MVEYTPAFPAEEFDFIITDECHRSIYNFWRQDLAYVAGDLDRDVVAPDQIRAVLATFRDRVFSEMFPGRADLPKTLIFAKDDSHAASSPSNAGLMTSWKQKS